MNLNEATEALYKWLDAQIKAGEIKLRTNKVAGK